MASASCSGEASGSTGSAAEPDSGDGVDWILSPAVALRGCVRPPGDKSIAHRALMLAAVADGVSRLAGLPDGADVASTASVLRALGVKATMPALAAA